MFKKDKKTMELGEIKNPGDIESILTEEAQKGWIVYAIMGKRYLFKKCNSVQMEYRLIYRGDKKFEEDFERYKELGWEVAAMDGAYLLLGQKTCYAPSESYFTEQEEKEWKILMNWSLAVYGSLAALAIIVFFWKAFYFENGIYIDWTAIANLMKIKIYVLLSGMPCIVGAIQLLRIRGYIKAVKECRTEVHHASGKRGRRSFVWRRMVIIGLLFWCLMIFGMDMMSQGKDAGNNITLLSADELFEGREPEKQYPFKEPWALFTESYSNSDFSYDVSKSGDENYTGKGIVQHNYIRPIVWNERGFLRSMAHEALEKAMEMFETPVEYSYEDIKTLEVKGLEHAYWIPEKHKQGYVLLVQKGNEFIWILVSGQSDPKRAVELLVRKR